MTTEARDSAGAEVTSRPIAVLGGLRTRVLEAGPAEDEEAVVFLHGHPGSAEDWTDLLSRAGSFARAVALDLPGFGEAEKLRPGKAWDYSAGSYTVFLAAALRELEIRRAHLVMHDLGGIGLLWGVIDPDAFASAVIIDTGVLIGFRWHPAARLYRAPVVGELMALLTNRRGFRAVLRLYNPQPRELPAHFVERWYDRYELNSRLAALNFYRATPAPAFERLREPLRRLDRPALVVWGRHDPAVPVEQAERQRESFPSAEVVVFEDSGHWPYLDDPERAAEAIVPFLRRQVSGAGTPG
jgi:pimeloyl-ACP methyl ester carboxylesterase